VLKLRLLPEGWTNMKKNGVILTSVLLVLGIQTPQFAQDTSIDPAKPEWAKHRIAIGLLRTINTAEVTHQHKNGSYATWQTILLSQPKYFDDFLARNNRTNQQTFQVGVVQPKAPVFRFADAPEILPGWSLRLNVHPDGQGYDVLLRDLTDDKCSYAALTDESGLIRQSKAIDCEI
jgi:hypothetical protein